MMKQLWSTFSKVDNQLELNRSCLSWQYLSSLTWPFSFICDVCLVPEDLSGLLPFIGLGLKVSNVEVIIPLLLCLQFYLATTRWRVNTYLAFPPACGYWVRFKCVVCVGTYLRTEGGRGGAVTLKDALCVWVNEIFRDLLPRVQTGENTTRR